MTQYLKQALDIALTDDKSVIYYHEELNVLELSLEILKLIPENKFKELLNKGKLRVIGYSGDLDQLWKLANKEPNTVFIKDRLPMPEWMKKSL